MAHNGAATHTSYTHGYTNETTHDYYMIKNAATEVRGSDTRGTSDVTTIAALFAPLILGDLPLSSQHYLSVFYPFKC